MVLVAHKIFTPSTDDPINYEAIERTLLDWHERFHLRKVLFDPTQMVSTSQRLAKVQIPIEPFVQSVPNLTAATSNLFDLVQSRALALYPDRQMRVAVSQAILVESSRGLRLGKHKQASHIDVIVALSMACFGAVQSAAEPVHDTSVLYEDNRFNNKEPSKEEGAREYWQGLAGQIAAYSRGQWWG